LKFEVYVGRFWETINPEVEVGVCCWGEVELVWWRVSSVDPCGENHKRWSWMVGAIWGIFLKTKMMARVQLAAKDEDETGAMVSLDPDIG
jgi:hypothetical protein